MVTLAPNVPWYLSRATGFVAYVLLFLTVLLGLAIRTKTLDRIVARWRVTDLHIVLSLLVLVFVAIHATVLLADSFIGFSAVQILIPFASTYQPVWTGVGVLMAYLLLIVAVSFPARRIIGYKAWRTLHYLTFLIYIGALGHGLFTGTDSPTLWAQAVYLSSAGCVVALLLYRVFAWSRREQALIARTPGLQTLAPEVTAYLMRPLATNTQSARPLPQAAALAAERTASVRLRALTFASGALGVAALMLLAAAVGPFHWVGHNAAAGAPSGTDTLTALSPDALTGFVDTCSGTDAQGAGRRATSYSMHLVCTGARDVTLDVQLQTAADFSGNLRTVSNQAILTDASGATLCSGTAAALNASGFDVSCDGQGALAGRSVRLTGTMQPGDGGRVQGALVATLGGRTA
ncbi:MAG: ferric reductase-like transmembrane domain-containing protein [Dehalococcoidia bacterium]